MLPWGAPVFCKESPHDFRKSTWGQSQKAIIDAEGQEPLSRGSEYLTFEARLLDKEMVVHYLFASDRLVGAKYELASPHLIENKYMRDFEDFKTILIQKYGQPQEDRKIWKGGDYFQNDPSQWGAAVSTGKLTCRAVWMTEKTEIDLVLTGADFKVTCEINYRSRELKHLAQPMTSHRPMKQDLSDRQIKETLDNL